MNQLHVVALNEGLRRMKALWRAAGCKELESIVLAPWTTHRRQDLPDLLDQLTPKIQELTRALEEEVEKRPVTRRLMTHSGVGVLTALAFELVIGTPGLFIVANRSSATSVWFRPKSPVEIVVDWATSANRATCCYGSCWWKRRRSRCAASPRRSKFFHVAMRRGRKIAKVAMARRLAVHLYWMWRQGRDYGQLQKFGSHAGAPGNRHGAQ
jgi:hypothetical protein